MLGGWITDVQDLKKMLAGFLIDIPPGSIDGLLQPEQKDFLSLLQTTPSMEKAAKAVSLLALWKQWLKQINQDGNGVFLEPNLMKSLNTLQEQAVNMVDLCRHVRQITLTIPAIVNVPLRKKTAQDTKTLIENRGFVVGKDLNVRLKLLITGALPIVAAASPEAAAAAAAAAAPDAAAAAPAAAVPQP